jgi:hypothetical protein
MLDCRLEASLHPEGNVTGQLDKGFPWFSLVLEQMLSWYQNSTLNFMHHMQHSRWTKYSNFEPKLPHNDRNVSLNYL